MADGQQDFIFLFYVSNNFFIFFLTLKKKTSVPDRTVVQPTPDERRVTAPAGLQEAIDELVAKVKDGRSFVRPSGTEVFFLMPYCHSPHKNKKKKYCWGEGAHRIFSVIFDHVPYI